MNPFILFFSIPVLIFIFTPASHAQDEPLLLEYRLLPGMDLMFTSTIDLESTGVYTEHSTRIIENRVIVLDVDESGTASIFSISKMLQRLIEGQSIESPYGNIYAYRWRWNPQSSEVHIPEITAEFGTGWTPMISFPPMPRQPVKLNQRSSESLPLYLNPRDEWTADHSILVQPHPTQDSHYLIASSLTQSTPLSSIITLDSLEHVITLDPNIALPQWVQTGYQMKMQDGNQVSFAQLQMETELTQSNRFRDEHIPIIQEEIAKFFAYQKQLAQLELHQADEIIQLLIDFSENSPMPLLRDAAQDLVLKHRFDLRLLQNFAQTLPGWEAPLFEAETVQGEEYIFNPKEKKIRVLLFWSLWWDPAEKALLDAEELRKTLDGEKVEFIGINLDGNPHAVKLYLGQTKIDMLTLWDQNYPKSGTAFRFGIKKVPSFVVIDDEGVIAARDILFNELVRLLGRML